MAERHGWGTVTDKQTGSGDPNVLQLGDKQKIRPIEPTAVKWRSHGVESPSDGEQFRSVTCPKGPDGRNDMPCPLCMKPADENGKQRFDISRRNATNVFVYNEEGTGGEVKVLIGGPSIFKHFDDAAKMGIDPTECDWSIFKTGTGKQTTYTVARFDKSPFQFPAEVTPDKLHDLDKYADPDSPEAILRVLEELGIDYDALEMPSFTLEQAESFQMPYGKHKGLTLEQLYANDREYLQYLHGVKKDQGSYGDPVFVALQTVLERYGDVDPLQALALAPPRPSTPAAAPTATSNGTVTLIGPDGAEGEYPASARDALLAAGYQLPAPPAPPEPEPAVAPAPTFPVTMCMDGSPDIYAPDESVMNALVAAGYAPKTEAPAAPAPAVEYTDETDVKVSISGAEATMTYGQAKPLVDSGVAQLLGPVSAAPAPATPEPSRVPEPSDDQQVQFSLKAMPAGASIAMPWKDAKRLFVEGQGDFQGDGAEDLRFYAQVSGGSSDADVKAEVEAAAAGDPHPPAGSPSNFDPSLTVANDDGTFQHPALPKKDYKTRGAITAALNKMKGQGEAPAAPTNGASADTPLLDQCRDMLSKLPEVSGDFNVMIELFQQTGGKRNIQEFDEAGLLKLKAALEAKLAAAAA